MSKIKLFTIRRVFHGGVQAFHIMDVSHAYLQRLSIFIFRNFAISVGIVPVSLFWSGPVQVAQLHNNIRLWYKVFDFPIHPDLTDLHKLSSRKPLKLPRFVGIGPVSSLFSVIPMISFKIELGPFHDPHKFWQHWKTNLDYIPSHSILNFWIDANWVGIVPLSWFPPVQIFRAKILFQTIAELW